MISFALFCENYSHNFVMAPSAVLGLNNTLNVPSGAYGFWVNKWGHWIEVQYEGHSAAARDIISKYLDYSGEDINPDHRIYKTMFDHGYIRVVVEHDLIHWEHPSKSFSPTSSQMKFFKELEMTYHIPVKRDTAASVSP